MGQSRRPGIDPEVGPAIASSQLASLSDDVLSELTTGAHRVVIDAGATVHAEGGNDPHVELVLGGLVRVLVRGPDGRTMTIRYCRRGALIGVATLFGPPQARPFAVQALVESELFRLQPERVRAVVRRNPAAANAMLRETSERVLAFTEELSGAVFATVRERLARHLLDLASERQRGDELFVPATQQEIADAIGTVREVVVRELRSLRSEGIVATGRDGVAILDPERLMSDAGNRSS